MSDLAHRWHDSAGIDRQKKLYPEVAKLRVFELQTDGPNYILSSDSLSRTGEWILRHALSRDDPSDQRAPQSTVSEVVSFGQSDISRLDEQTQKLRRNDSSPHTESYSRALSTFTHIGRSS